MGTTSLVLAMIEADAFRDDLSVRRPVGTLHEVSHDTDPAGQGRAGRRPPDDGARAALGVPRPRRRLRRPAVGRRARQRHRRGHALVGHRARQARPRPDGGPPRGRLGRQAGGARGLPRARLARLGRPAPEGRRPAVVRRARRPGPGAPAGRDRPARGARRRGRRAARRRRAAERHPGLVPGHLPAPLPGRRRRGVLGLGDLRRRRPAHLAAGADARAAQGHRGRRRRAGAQRAGCRVAAARAGGQRATRQH